jgi:hypothetical protein
VRIESRGNEQDVWLELSQDRQHDLFEHNPVVLVGRAHFERKVDRPACARAISNLIGRSGSRIVGKLMRGDVQHVRIVLEDVLRAVPMVHVVIDDRDVAGPERFRVSGGDGDVVEETETHRPVVLGMVSGRPR